MLTVISMESHSCHSSKWNTLVRWTKEDVKSRYSGGMKDLCIGIGSGVEERASVEETSIEEIGRYSSRGIEPLARGRYR